MSGLGTQTYRKWLSGGLLVAGPLAARVVVVGPHGAKRGVDVLEGNVERAFVDLRAGVSSAVADDTFLVVGVDGGFTERAGVLVDGAACLDDPVGVGELRVRLQ